MDCEISFHHKFLYNSFSHLHKTHKINRLTITVRTAPNNGESTKNHPSRMIWNIFIAMRIRKNTPMIPHISIFLIISLLSFLSSHLCFSGSIHGADLYMEGPKLQGRYKLLVNLRILQFQAEQVIFINDGFPDRGIRYFPPISQTALQLVPISAAMIAFSRWISASSFFEQVSDCFFCS